jgi:cathepsin L
MNKQLIALLVLLGAASVYLYSLENKTEDSTYGFQQFKLDFNKKYMREGEEQYRKNIFIRNLVKINEHNANPSNTYTMGVNQFTDLTQAEFAALYLTLQVPSEQKVSKNIDVTTSSINGDIDWSAVGKVTPVKNQGQCGSCWAFSAVAAVESEVILYGHPEADFSEQQLVDCSRSYGNQGCNGGWMDSAFQYIRDKGITSEAAYPYVARDQACKTDGGSQRITGFVDVPGCDSLLNALFTRPVSVAVDAGNWSPYRSGIFTNCGSNVNHGVLLTGASDSFWKIKNSWGPAWGESGFIRLARGNTCAICSYPSFPTLL